MRGELRHVFGLAALLLSFGLPVAAAQAESSSSLPTVTAALPAPSASKIVKIDPVLQSWRAVDALLTALRTRDAGAAYALLSPKAQKAYADAKSYLKDIRYRQHALYSHLEAHRLSALKGEKSIIHRVELELKDSDPRVILVRVVEHAPGDWRVEKAVTLSTEDQAI